MSCRCISWLKGGGSLVFPLYIMALGGGVLDLAVVYYGFWGGGIAVV